MSNHENENEYAIQTFDLTKSFGNRKAVDKINLVVKKGDIFSLLGPNGAGKTTTIKMLTGVLKPTVGTAKIMDYDITRNPSEVKGIIDISPQETAIAGHLTAWENLILMGGINGLKKEDTEKRAKKLIKLMGLTERANEQVQKFSGGMQRRLSIAMALISDPPILFLDEPTLGLDPQARRVIWEQIEQLKGEKTIILTTHYLEEADALADRVAIISQGSIIAEGTPQELKKNIHGLQTMIIKGQNLSSPDIERLKETYPYITKIDGGIKIEAQELIFDEIVDYLRSRGVKINWLSMKEPSLDDVFLDLTGEEVN
ncbi:ATP-binding cassette domain-containing protein [Methanobacterium ferruginis]|uniref:ATP-binding cassette domain-containing protein n=1 Tax=Methanobacterium ferruginis TaxID=710191 RepID=UPI002572C8E3|nr:ATP-binding cassette domain-containing protein [Methanobacterium ferruginis]BDZ69237.1 daunorubicin resistance protein DrrA family ABC transporter ATP-binding protein [Methanobacterium ferruginis]